ncbi:MAG TPA: adenine phosphoribosyltransferase [Nitrospinota bacterium]|nr:adenine phosphoribosyltransferase [Nitrospinota bacterium]|tara:strand:+ start:21671 stop:22204 length:534 start_codon:yes stop_codon:yes gene_type:complete
MPEQLKKAIREIPNFPKEGILFYDLTTLFSDPLAFRKTIDIFVNCYTDVRPDVFVGIEARGFVLASALAYALKTGVILVRKPGKLPYKTYKESYELEYGTNEIEIHQDAIKPGQKVVIVDDLLATGGTLEAAAKLVEKVGGNILELACIVELTFLPGRARLEKYKLRSLLTYDNEKV